MMMAIVGCILRMVNKTLSSLEEGWTERGKSS
jgi:hypothetical protein